MISKPFKLERGVRQGDLLSPYLFIAAVEMLAIAIRQNPAIKGIVIGQEETKLLQYADDTTAMETLFIRDYRRCQIRPKIQGFRTKLPLNTKRKASSKKGYFKEKWVLIPI